MTSDTTMGGADAELDDNTATEQAMLNQAHALDERLARAEVRALRAEIASKFGISPEDRDVLLSGIDEATLNAQAARLAERATAHRATGNVAPREGTTRQTGNRSKHDQHQFLANLFGQPE